MKTKLKRSDHFQSSGIRMKFDLLNHVILMAFLVHLIASWSISIRTSQCVPLSTALPMYNDRCGAMTELLNTDESDA